MKNLYLCMILLAFTACGRAHSMNDSSASSDQMEIGTSTEKSEQYSYAFTLDDCKTGSYVFGTKTAYCKALKNEELNHACAQEERKALLDSDCAGVEDSIDTAASSP